MWLPAVPSPSFPHQTPRHSHESENPPPRHAVHRRGQPQGLPLQVARRTLPISPAPNPRHSHTKPRHSRERGNPPPRHAVHRRRATTRVAPTGCPPYPPHLSRTTPRHSRLRGNPPPRNANGLGRRGNPCGCPPYPPYNFRPKPHHPCTNPPVIPAKAGIHRLTAQTDYGEATRRGNPCGCPALAGTKRERGAGVPAPLSDFRC